MVMGRELNMADLKGGFAKTVQKHAVRAKEKILQNLGKADKTTDDVFDEYESNFNKQQLNANRLQKEVTNYLRCARAMHGASKCLFEALSEVYESEWVGQDLIYSQAQNSDMMWTDFCHKLQDQCLGPLTAYTQDFPELRKKIDKRGRKLVDYDSHRHQLENLQRTARRDEYKIARVKDQLETARLTYEGLNKELYDELPAIYDHRIPSTANGLQTLFAAEATFMHESSKISQELEAIAEKLSKECEKGTYYVKRGYLPRVNRPISGSVSPSQSSPSAPAKWYDLTPSADLDLSKSPGDALKSEVAERCLSSENEGLEAGGEEKDGNERGDELQEPPHLPLQNVLGTYPCLTELKEDACTTLSPPPPTTTTSVPADSSHISPPSPPSQIPRKNKESSSENQGVVGIARIDESRRPYEEIQFDDKKFNGTSASLRTNGEIGTRIPLGATADGLPSGVLYRVRATYKYTPEDVDELGFEVGETMQVVEYDDPEEQEEGWLCGIKESTNEKGLFPANFTLPI